jgi:3-deoxy-D-manno-octulosonic acid kinase
MPGLLQYTTGPFRIASRYSLDERDLAKLHGIFRGTELSAPVPALGGRRPVTRTRLAAVGPVVVKHYRRGGVLGHLVRETYLTFGITRCQAEFEMMFKVHRLGCSVPEPVAYARQGGLFSKAWLVTREVEQSQTLAQLCATSPQLALEAMEPLCREVATLVEHRIVHADFHPGNVLVDGSGRVYLVDFDKAAVFKGDAAALRRRYRNRWCQAVNKHGLPRLLCDELSI